MCGPVHRLMRSTVTSIGVRGSVSCFANDLSNFKVSLLVAESGVPARTHLEASSIASQQVKLDA